LVALVTDITRPLQLHFLLYLHFNFLAMEKASSVSNCYFMGMNVEGVEGYIYIHFLNDRRLLSAGDVEGNGSNIFQCRMPHSTKFLIFGLRGRTFCKCARALVAARFELRLGGNVLLVETLINIRNYIRMD